MPPGNRNVDSSTRSGWSKGTATGSVALYDVLSLVPDTDTATITQLYGVTATASSANGQAPSLLDETVTLTVSTETLYWVNLAGHNEVTMEDLPLGLTDVTDLDVSASTFVDPHFAINPEWAAANPEAAANVVIERSSTTEVLDIAITPWFKGPNLINVRSRYWLVAVAVLGNEALPAESIDPSTLRFGPGEAEPRRWPRSMLRDIDRDGDLDLLAYFRTGDAGLSCEDTEAVLSAQTYAGLSVAGADAIRPFPCRRWRRSRRGD